MKVDIIIFSTVSKIRRFIPFLTYSYFLLLVFLDRSTNTEIQILIYSGLIVIITWFLADLFSDSYKKIGSISIKSSDNCEIELNGVKRPIDINSILLYYGGYNGELHETEFFITFSNGRNGTCNYLVINNIAYQIILHNKEDWNRIKSILNEFHSKDKKAELIILSFPDVFRCLFNIGKKPFEKYLL